MGFQCHRRSEYNPNQQFGKIWVNDKKYLFDISIYIGFRVSCAYLTNIDEYWRTQEVAPIDTCSKGGGPPDQVILDILVFNENALRELDKPNAPDNSAKLIAGAATAFFQIDTDVHDLYPRILKLHSDTQG